MSHPDCKFTKTDQHGIPSKPNMRSRSISLPLRVSNGYNAAQSGSRSPVRMKAQSRSQYFVDQRYANSASLNAVSQSNILKSTGCLENSSHKPSSDLNQLDISKVANSDDPEIMIEVSVIENVSLLALDPRNLSNEINEVDSQLTFYRIGTELENRTATAESTFYY
ncbi:unnamed protein product [Albugo candida]|uniref:Uncharacterized protein n=1 Tax=Albugo candida TaxID=65357 RepID=A0A024FVI0_9STRA|nr:unnamed protein product [Albugo candida]|eukprot:CCI10669.1 unnamed protein product [Albugo candida]